MKTIKDAASDYAEETKDTTNGMLYADSQDAFRAGAEFAQRWIPVEEELPETNEFEESKIIIIKGKYGIDIGRYYSMSKRFFLASGNFEVTHWRYVELQ